MIFLVLSLLTLSLFRCRISHHGLYDDYLERHQCNAIKGICILLVFIRHVWPYVLQSGYSSGVTFDRLSGIANGIIGQLLVVMFLFYSGYGIMESIRNKGKNYIRSMPTRRIATTLLNFDVAVLLYVGIAFLTGEPPSWKRIALSLVGWSDVGNSNWYIFDIVLCYASAFIAFSLFPITNTGERGILIMTILTVVAAGILAFVGKSGYWYNTLLCFPAGAWYSEKKHQIEKVAAQWSVTGFCFLFFLFLPMHVASRHLPPFWGNASNVLFSLLVIWTTMKIRLGNPILEWMGEHLFPIYIYQRIPMILLLRIDGGGFVFRHPFLFVSACLTITVIIAHLYRHWRIQLA